MRGNNEVAVALTPANITICLHSGRRTKVNPRLNFRTFADMAPGRIFSFWRKDLRLPCIAVTAYPI
jgi:hypothetical protein